MSPANDDPRLRLLADLLPAMQRLCEHCAQLQAERDGLQVERDGLYDLVCKFEAAQEQDVKTVACPECNHKFAVDLQTGARIQLS